MLERMPVVKRFAGGEKIFLPNRAEPCRVSPEGKLAGLSTIVEDVDKNVRNLLQGNVMHLIPAPRKRAEKPTAADSPVGTVVRSLTSAPE
jgi:hypothetical protein